MCVCVSGGRVVRVKLVEPHHQSVIQRRRTQLEYRTLTLLSRPRLKCREARV